MPEIWMMIVEERVEGVAGDVCHLAGHGLAVAAIHERVDRHRPEDPLVDEVEALPGVEVEADAREAVLGAPLAQQHLTAHA